LAVVRAYERMLTGDLAAAHNRAACHQRGSKADRLHAHCTSCRAPLLILHGDVQQGRRSSTSRCHRLRDLILCQEGSSTASWSAPRASPKATWPRSGPRRTERGARRTPSEAHGRCRVRRAETSDCAGRATRGSGAHRPRGAAAPPARSWPLNSSDGSPPSQGNITGAEEAPLAVTAPDGTPTPSRWCSGPG
jgi:hypothetical protein